MSHKIVIDEYTEVAGKRTLKFHLHPDGIAKNLVTHHMDVTAMVPEEVEHRIDEILATHGTEDESPKVFAKWAKEHREFVRQESKPARKTEPLPESVA